MTLSELLAQINHIPLEIFVAGFFVTGGLLALIRDWRLSLAALLFQYLNLGLVLAQVIRPEIAFAKVLVGLFVCPMLYLSARQSGWRRNLTVFSHGLRGILGQRQTPGRAFPPGHIFRLMSILLIAVTTFALARNYPITDLPNSVTVAMYWLILIGLLVLILTEDPMKTGQGLLTFVIGFELWYTVLEDSLLMVGLWGVVNVLIALAVGYLTAVRGIVLEEEF